MKKAEREKRGTGFGVRKYRDIVDHLPVGVYRTTADGRILEANPALAAMLGFPDPLDLTHYNVRDFYVHRTDRTRHLQKLKKKPVAFDEFELRRIDGSTFWCRDYPRSFLDKSGRVSTIEGVLIDITERKKAEDQLDRTLKKLARANRKLKEMSLKDDLTGLYNRRGFLTMGQQHLKTILRIKKPAFLLFLDVDGLKSVNDTYGHALGDDALVAVGRIMKETLRESDIAGRIGGDEFAAIVTRTSRGDEKRILRRFQVNIADFNKGAGLPFDISLSLGIIPICPDATLILEDFLSQADLKMYMNKGKEIRKLKDGSATGIRTPV
jgi:diguanylate cyclase (GGDEF)-like protein/PAS domain S-box-containing protein